MKKNTWLLVSGVTFACFLTQAQGPRGEGWRITEMGADFRKWTRTTWTTNLAGARLLKTNAVVELASGMHRKVNGAWVATEPRIIATTNGARCFGAAQEVMARGKSRQSGVSACRKTLCQQP
jgi:hypothetical protein